MIGRAALPCPPAEVDGFLSEPTPAVVEMVAGIDSDFMVLGAAGKMGLHVCRMLREAMDAAGMGANRVIAVSRFSNAGAEREFREAGVETVRCDLADADALAELPDCPEIVFMAGAKFGTADRPDLLRQMNIEMPAMVGARFKGARITAFSTGCVYSYCPVDSLGSNEGSPTEPVGEYARSCLGREEAFRAEAARSGTRVSLIRLNYSVEFRYGVPVDIARAVLEGSPIDVSMGHVNMIWQRDAVVHALLAHAHASPEPFIVNVTGDRVMRVRDLAFGLGELLGRDPVIAGEEEPTAWLNDASKAHALFGSPETGVEQILEWVAAWQLAGLPLLGKRTGFEKRDGKF